VETRGVDVRAGVGSGIIDASAAIGNLACTF
jgi:hypothetical protein